MHVAPANCQWSVMEADAVRALAKSLLSVLIDQEERLGAYDAPLSTAVMPLTTTQRAAVYAARRSKNKARVAKSFGVSRSTLYRWMEET